MKAAWEAIALAALTGTLSLAAASSARASCDGPQFGLLWSYPANGAVDVPIDADLFVTGQLGGPLTLDGEPLPIIAPGVYDLGRLEPLTRYEVRSEGPVIAFTTGEEAAFAPRAPQSDVRLTRNPVDYRRCPIVLDQGCFDTGNRTSVRFDAGAGIAWLLEVTTCGAPPRQLLWPGVCGPPVIDSEDRIVCASARSTNGNGFSESTGVICSAPDVPPGTLPRSSSCTGAWPPEDELTLLADDGVTVGTISGPLPPGAEIPPDQPDTSPTPAASEPAAGCILAAAPAPSGRSGITAIASATLLALATLARRRLRR